MYMYKHRKQQQQNMNQPDNLPGQSFSWSAEQGRNGIFLCPRSRLRICSRETDLAVRSRVNLLILHTQAESRIFPISAAAASIICLYRQTPSDIGSVPSLSGRAITYRWRSLPNSAGTGPIVLEVIPVTGAATFCRSPRTN